MFKIYVILLSDGECIVQVEVQRVSFYTVNLLLYPDEQKHGSARKLWTICKSPTLSYPKPLSFNLKESI